MSIIQQLQNENAELRKRVQALTAEKAQTEKDIAIVAKTTAEAWKSLGIEIKEKDESDTNGKMSFTEITKISLSIGKKLFLKQISLDDLMQKWDSIAPILTKYQHVLKDNQ